MTVKRAFILFSVLLALRLGSPAAQGNPNIILFYIDDWAWNGSPVAMDDAMKNSRMPVMEMPNLEKLAAEGMKFRNAYGSHQCEPARASIQTGQSGPRNGVTLVLGQTKDDYFDLRQQFQNLPVVPVISSKLKEEAVTIPEALKPYGYVSAHLGKWHLYCDPGREGYVLHDGETTNTEGNTLKGEKQIPADFTDPKLMFSLTEKAIGFMEQQVKARQPFYLQISHYAMHEGRECLPATREKYAQHPLVQAYYKKAGTSAEQIKRKDDPAIWLGMGEDLDGRIGAVIDKAHALGIAENTYFIVVADNGYRHKELLLTAGMTQPLHGHKWWDWEGGIRVPMIVKGPGIKPGSVFQGNVVNYDLLPTFVEWAGGDPAQLKNIDGVSLAGFMAGKEPDDTFLNRPLYFHCPHYRSEIPHSAVVAGPYKVMHFYDAPGTPMLFDLSKDPGETTNIAKENPDLHKKLFAGMMDYFKEVGARIPKPNPDYKPEVYQKLKSYQEFMELGAFQGKRPLAEDEQPKPPKS